MQYGDHKGHETKLIKQVETEAEAKVKQLEAERSQLDTQYKGVEDILSEKKDGLFLSAKASFQQIRDSLDQKEQQFLSEIAQFFEVEGLRMNDIIGLSSGYRQSVSEKIESLRNLFKDKRCFEALEGSSLEGTFKLLNNILTHYTNHLNERLEATSQTLDQYIKGQVVETLSQLRFPASQLNEDMSVTCNQAKDALNGKQTGFDFTVNPTQVSNGTNHTGSSDSQTGYIFSQAGHNTSGLGNTSTMIGPSNGVISQKPAAAVVKSLIESEISGDMLIISPRVDETDKATPKHISLQMMDVEEKPTTMDLRFGKCDFSKALLSELLGNLKNVKDMRHLKMDFTESSMSDGGFTTLCESIFSSDTNLSTLEVWITACSITDEGIIAMLNEMSSATLKNLERLSLDFGIVGMTDRTVNVMATTVLPLMEKLEHLELHFDFADISDSAVSLLFTDHLSGLKTFMLDIENTKLSDQSIEAFAREALPKMNKLEHLEIMLYAAAINGDGFLNLFEVEIPTLKTLVLDVENTRVSDDFLVAFASLALPKMRELEHLELRMGGTEMSDAGMLKLLKSDMKRLRSLVLHLNNTQVSDTSVDLFIKHTLPQFEELEKLDIRVDYSNVTEQCRNTLYEMQNGLRRVRRLGSA